LVLEVALNLRWALLLACATWGHGEPAAREARAQPSPTEARGPAQPQTNAPAQADVAPAAAHANESRDYSLEGRHIRLETGGAHCRIIDRTDAADAQALTLELAPPCHVLLWAELRPAPGHVAESGGVAVGNAGEPVAWRYPSAGNATVIAVIGDPVPELRDSSSYRERTQHGYHCAGSMQGVLLRADGASVGRKHADVGVLCAEVSLDEKDYWILAHDRAPRSRGRGRARRG
jgi:hypothetical protein